MKGLSLKEFIKDSLIEICEAVEMARAEKDYIAPKYFIDANSKEKASVVEFDLAVTVSQRNTEDDYLTSKAEGGGNIVVVSGTFDIKGSHGKNESSESSTISRINFSVPVFFQFDEEKRKKTEERNKSLKVGMSNYL